MKEKIVSWSPWIREQWEAIEPRRPDETIEEVLLRRDGIDADGKDAFINAGLADLPSPFAFRDIDLAATFAAEVIKNGGRTLIYGDYDADGLTSTSVIARFLEEIGVPYDVIIPDRLEEGYGLHQEIVDEILQNPPDLCITVDCGSANKAEIDRLMQGGVPCIVTDHHECPVELPQAVAFINPKDPKETYPYRELAGVGVAFNFVVALAAKLGVETFNPAPLLALVALGTVADAMPLTGVNRILVKEGLKALPDRAPLGLQVLLDKNKGYAIDSTTLGFYLAPRLNAAGRLGVIEPALDLLLTEDLDSALQAATELEALNERRRDIEAEITRAAEARIAARRELLQSDVLLLWDETWHPGVIGIVASRLSETFDKPVLLLAPGPGDLWRGSGRAPEGVDLVALMERHADLLENYGGHTAAGGFSVKEHNLAALEAALFKETIDGVQTQPTAQYFTTLKHEEVTKETFELIRALGPYGNEREEPLFLLDNVILREVRPLKAGKHFSCLLGLNNNDLIKGISFSRGELLDILRPGDRLRIYGYLSENTYRGKTDLQFRIVDLEKVPEERAIYTAFDDIERVFKDGVNKSDIVRAYGVPEADLMIDPRLIQGLYPFLQKYFAGGRVTELFRLTEFVRARVLDTATPFTVKRILRMFGQYGFFDIEELSDNHLKIKLAEGPDERVKLSATPSWRALAERGFLPALS